MGICFASVLGDNQTLETIDGTLLQNKFEELGQGHIFGAWEKLNDAER